MSRTRFSVALMSAIWLAPLSFGANLAFDAANDPAYNSGWNNGSNGGTGFSPWELRTTGNGGFNEFAGHFVATTAGNGDLNDIATAGRAWGTFANDANSSETTQIAAGFRNLTGSDLSIGQSIRVRVEHGLILGGSTNANVDPNRTGGWTGIILNPTIQNEPDPFNGFGDLAGQFAVGFRGGDAAYSIFVPSGAPTQVITSVPFGIGGHDITITPTSASTWQVVIQQLSAGGSTFTINGNGSLTGITRVGLINRNTEQGNAYFNSLAVVPEPGSLAMMALAGMTLRRQRAK